MHVGGCSFNASRSEAMGKSNPMYVSLDQHFQDASHLFIFFSVHHFLDLSESDVVFEVYVEGEKPFVEIFT